MEFSITQVRQINDAVNALVSMSHSLLRIAERMVDANETKLHGESLRRINFTLGDLVKVNEEILKEMKNDKS